MNTATQEMKASAKSRAASSNKTKYAQYFTPAAVADYMVQMFDDRHHEQVSILDPGAGQGILGLSLLEAMTKQGRESTATLIEIDEQFFQELKNRSLCMDNAEAVRVLNGDFTRQAFELLHSDKRFTHVIMNPPYFKLQRDSFVSDYLLSGGVDVTNMYTAFMWLGLDLLAENGQMVAIVPRSFCNGPYFRKFREHVAASASIEAIHSFGSRDKVFSEDQVLQENVIIRFSKQAQSDKVTVTYSVDQGFSKVQEAVFLAHKVISEADPELTIFIPAYQSLVEITDFAQCSLSDIGLGVSTGPVVDFRQKEYIAQEGGSGSVPLLYPAHMKDGHIVWPIDNLLKKGQHYFPQPDLWSGTKELPSGDKNVSPADGYYVIVRRFSSKEEKRRIYAAVVDPLSHPNGMAFENHLNYFHASKHGFDRELAFGLSAYLNSAMLDEYFRTFSGHTQVNATDLKNIPYPSAEQLREIGRVALRQSIPIEAVVTEKLLRECESPRVLRRLDSLSPMLPA